MNAAPLAHEKHIAIQVCRYEPDNVNIAIRPWLSEKELTRLAGMKSPRRQAEFTLSRFLIKRELGLTKHNASRIHLSLLKGYLRADGYPGSAIALSHSAGTIAFTVFDPRQHSLGLDIEVHNEKRNVSELSNLFNPAEHTASAIEFYRIWTLKEALAKALNQPLQTILSSSVLHLLAQHNFSFHSETPADMTWSVVHNMSPSVPVTIHALQPM
ncbi:4'-phosphopantetheinyl transferase superfamily protein [Aestuariibacter sp. A3R04]|uniref:4'-phosphopantetheinyl transferase family protein n=1 Tax=Aestuariibacter sp. A3R04 TaxID=2841571 RepID=UPI001C08CD35|nr:4'-phosphopantetheinyl transferase superfamily protein [Aestuariibacter sp. A3R04]MBU3021181.1 4'-phosphopantetheinyl transferase superfamily protein [Aestuariibacter sp. A3R04]